MTQMAEQHPSARGLLLVIALATSISSFTLWLIDSWIRYPLFVFEIITIVVLYLIVSGYDLKLKPGTQAAGSLNLGLIIDIILTASSLSLLFIGHLQVQAELIQLILALLLTSLLSGYALLNISGLNRHFSRLENLVFSYILSYIFTGLITFVLLPLDADLRTTVILFGYVGLGLASAAKHRQRIIVPDYPPRSLTKGIDLIALLLSMGFYALSFYFIYPGFALLPGSDISRHYANSVVLWRTPDLYIGSAYLLANLHESAFFFLSGSSLVSGQSALASLNFMLPFAFYVMVKRYLEGVDSRLPSLALLFWSLFTNSFGGLSWVYFVYLKFTTTGQDYVQLLSSAADKTYNGTIYGILGLWYVPATVSIVLMVALICLMKQEEMARSKYISLFAVLTMALFLTHVAEAVVLALFLAVYGIVSKSRKLRIEDSITSAIIGFLFAAMVYYLLSSLTTRFIMSVSQLVAVAVPIIALLSSLLLRRGIRTRLPSISRAYGPGINPLVKASVTMVFFVYIVAFLSWALLLGSFHTSQVDATGYVPWFMYPVMLGVNGLLAVLALYYVAGRKPYEGLGLLVAFMIVTFLLGRAVSITNNVYFDTGYWEKRFVWFIKIPLAALAPITVIFIVDKLKGKNLRPLLKALAAVTIVGIIVSYGMPTTFLNLEYWNNISNDANRQPTQAQIEAVTALKGILATDPRAWVASATGTSSAVVTFAAPPDMLGLVQLLDTAYTPEMAFSVLYRHPAYDHPYLYISPRDAQQLSKYGDVFLPKYIQGIPVVFKDAGAGIYIYNVSKLVPPQQDSDEVLIVPFDKSITNEQSLSLAYSILSQGGYNYSTAYDIDEKALNAGTLILPFDPPTAGIFDGHMYDNYTQWSIVKGSWQMASEGLSGGKAGEYGEGIVLSPVFAENFTASFSVRPVGGNATVLNYVGLVYSWIDQKNYRLADVFFNSDGYVYVLLRTFVDGVEKTSPAWPGIKTGVRWDFGKELNVSVTVVGSVGNISIDGVTFLSTALDNVPGKVGLRYYRLNQVSFSAFSIDYKLRLRMRPVGDFVDFVQSGGRLVILNFNGLGYFANELFETGNSTIAADEMEGSATRFTLPMTLAVQEAIPKLPETNVLSWYTDSSQRSAFIVRQAYGNGEIFYVNLRPIVDAIQRTGDLRSFYNIWGRLLDPISLPKMDRVVQSIDAYFKEAHLLGNVTVQTNSVLFPLRVDLRQLAVHAANGSYVFSNITGIRLTNYPALTIEAQNVTTTTGRGFYAVLKVDSDFIIRPSANTLDLIVETDGGELQVNDADMLTLRPRASFDMLARTPELSAEDVTFIEFYPSSFLQEMTRTYGQNLRVVGMSSFTVSISDTYSAVKGMDLSGSFIRDPPVVTFDELATVPTAFLLSLILFPAFVGAMLIATMRRVDGHE